MEVGLRVGLILVTDETYFDSEMSPRPTLVLLTERSECSDRKNGVNLSLHREKSWESRTKSPRIPEIELAMSALLHFMIS